MAAAIMSMFITENLTQTEIAVIDSSTAIILMGQALKCHGMITNNLKGLNFIKKADAFI